VRPESGEWVTRHFLQSRFSQASNIFRYRHGIRMSLANEADRQAPGSCPAAAREAEESHKQFERLHNGTGYCPAKGYAVGRYDRVKATGAPQAPFAFLDRYRTGSHLKFLHRLIDWCESNEVRIILVDMPVTADLEDRYSKEFTEFQDRLNEVERDRRVTIMRPTRSEIGLTDAHFADVIHMNRDGARRFSDWLMVHLGNLPQTMSEGGQP
jgi:hypothetical protein